MSGLTHWEPYAPDTASPWDLRRVAHLHRRAGLAPTWHELQRDLKAGPQQSIRRLVEGRVDDPSRERRVQQVAEGLEESSLATKDPLRLQASWFYRLILGQDELGERLTLFWHDQFATSNVKVRNLTLMRRQIATLRKHRRSDYGTLVRTMVRDPALLLWLDASANRREHPNENLARELMELFTTGVGPYTEADVKEAARALTGWTRTERGLKFRTELHDDSPKTVLGRTERFDPDSLAVFLVEHPATSRRLARQLCNWLMGSTEVDDAAVEEIAEGMHQRALDVSWALTTILSSRSFFAADNLRNRVASPVELVSGPVRALECIDPPVSTVALADWSARMGHRLLYPPNVGGWPQETAWLSTRALIAGHNFAAHLLQGTSMGRRAPLDVLQLAERHGAEATDEVLEFFLGLLVAEPLSDPWRERLAGVVGSSSRLSAGQARDVVLNILTSPEARLS